MINSRSLDDLHPFVKKLALRLQSDCAAAGIPIIFTSTLRDQEYQTMLYSQGRTAPGNVVTNAKIVQWHGVGCAFDVCQNIKGREYESAVFPVIGRLGKALGLEWGGDWKSFVDMPHFQWTSHGLTLQQVKAGMIPAAPAEAPAPPAPAEKPLDNTPGDYAKSAVEKAIARGIIRGDERGDLMLRSPATRQDILVMLDRCGLL